MITLSLSQIASILEAQLIGDGNLIVENVSTDSRKNVSNGLFFALKGENLLKRLSKAVLPPWLNIRQRAILPN